MDIEIEAIETNRCDERYSEQTNHSRPDERSKNILQTFPNEDFDWNNPKKESPEIFSRKVADIQIFPNQIDSLKNPTTSNLRSSLSEIDLTNSIHIDPYPYYYCRGDQSMAFESNYLYRTSNGSDGLSNFDHFNVIDRPEAYKDYDNSSKYPHHLDWNQFVGSYSHKSMQDNDITFESNMNQCKTMSCLEKESRYLRKVNNSLWNTNKAKGIYTSSGQKIRRPPNAFMIFAKDRRREILYSNQNLTNKEVSKQLGIEWHNLPFEAKLEYQKLFEQLRLEHQIKYPGYYYSPVEARRRKEQRRLKKFIQK
ncbi:sodium bicarbonate transporter-like protein 11 [Sarcoptes scabiei]|nr:sodium bicarbonate transporter-like protein 11 [Sarcoptes scabiei]